MKKCKITQVFCNEDDTPPIIVEFQNGELNASKTNKLRCEVLEDKKSKKKTVTVNNNKISYTGELPDESDEDENTFIAVRNKDTNEIKLYKTTRAMLRAVVPKKRDVLDSSLTENNTTILQLNKEFGSKKTKRYTEQMEKLKINIDNVKEELEKTVANITVTDNDLTLQTSEKTSWKPPINREASRAEDVYNLNDILTTSDLENLSEEALKVLDSDCEDLYPVPFIANEILQLRKTADSSLSQRKCQILLYVDCVIKFFKQFAKEACKKTNVPCTFSPEIGHKIQESFTVLSEHGRTRPNNMKDKGICYTMVLLIIACNEINLENLAKEFKCGISKLQELGRILSLSPSGGNKSKLILKLPLPVLSNMNKKFSKKKK